MDSHLHTISSILSNVARSLLITTAKPFSCLRLCPDQTSSVSTSALLDVLASREALPQVREEVALLLNVAFTEQGCNGPCGLLSMVEGDAPVLCQKS